MEIVVGTIQNILKRFEDKKVILQKTVAREGRQRITNVDLEKSQVLRSRLVRVMIGDCV